MRRQFQYCFSTYLHDRSQDVTYLDYRIPVSVGNVEGSELLSRSEVAATLLRHCYTLLGSSSQKHYAKRSDFCFNPKAQTIAPGNATDNHLLARAVLDFDDEQTKHLSTAHFPSSPLSSQPT
eukprot:scaffold167_cov191-Alexandrium_tamarense.AAC.13